jgi:hypothetical protein
MVAMGSFSCNSFRIACHDKVCQFCWQGLSRCEPQTVSIPVYQDVQGALQRVAMFSQRPCPIAQLGARHRSQFLNAHDPCRSFSVNGGRQARKSGIAPRIAQGRNDARSVDADQIRLQIDDKLPVPEAIEIELSVRPATC